MISRTTFLVLEPRPKARSVLCAVLDELERPTLLHAETTRMAADVLAGVRVDCVFVDLGFPEQRGLHFIQGLRQGLYCEDRALPVIAIAATPEASLIARARDAGVNGLAAFPFSRATIAMQLARVRAHARRFVESQHFAGPDRRHWSDPNFTGPDQRGDEDGASDTVLVG